MKHSTKKRDGESPPRSALDKPHMLGVERYAMVPQRLLGKDMLTGQQLRVYSALAMHANDESRAWPSLKKLSDITGLERSNVQKTLRQLEMDTVILSFPSASQWGTTIYELQPDPSKYLDEYFDEESGPGGFLCSIAFTGLACLIGDYPGIKISWRIRKAGEVNAAIENAAADREAGKRPILTPGIKLIFENEHLITGEEAWAAPWTLEGMELWLASGMLPWSVMATCIYKANEKPVKRKQRGVVTDTTPVVTDTTPVGIDTTGCSNRYNGGVVNTTAQLDHLLDQGKDQRNDLPLSDDNGHAFSTREVA